MKENRFLQEVVRQEWKWLFLGAIFSFFLASLILSGWPEGFIPNLKYPFAYGGDASFTSWQIQRTLEGGLFNNPRSGYPFGSNFLDYPHSDNGNFIILKLFGLLSGSYYGAVNLYILMAFPLTFLTGFLTLRYYSLRLDYAFTAALLFAFAPFHLFRMLSHLYYGWYFVVPLYFLIGLKIFSSTKSNSLKGLKKLFFSFIVLIILSSFGVYYTFFGIMTFITCGIAAGIKYKKFTGLYLSILLSSMLAFGIGLNILPNIIYKFNYGPNLEVAQRNPVETEIYALKIAHLLFPFWNHRVHQFRAPFQNYAKYFALSEATYSSSLGLIASFGFIFLIFCIFSSALGKQIDIHLQLLSVLVFSYLLISTVGSLNVFFALYISPLIRGWNRISIFISFAALAGFFLALQNTNLFAFIYEKNKFIFNLILLGILTFGLLDQIPKSINRTTSYAKNRFLEDNAFIHKIEHSLPKNAAIYQLPYMSFPENGSLHNLPEYDLLNTYLNSSTLRWSHAGIKGREGDLFYRFLSQEPLEKQIQIIKRLNFSGIYIDKRGFSDHGEGLINQLNELVGQPAFTRSDNQIVFYRLYPSQQRVLDSRNARQIMEQAGYIVTKYGSSYEATFSEGIDFKRQGLPSFILSVQGLSSQESWGRWSDANENAQVRFNFATLLPNTFNLLMALKAFGPNIGKQLKIRIGSKIYYVKLHEQIEKTQLAVNLNGEKVRSIEFFPPDPISPHEQDRRRVAIGFIDLKIVKKT